MSFAFCAMQGPIFRVIRHRFQESIRARRRVWRCAIAVVVLLLSCVLFQGLGAAQVQPIRRILILNEVNPSYPAMSSISQGIQTALSSSPYHLEIYAESLDNVLFPDPAVQQKFR